MRDARVNRFQWNFPQLWINIRQSNYYTHDLLEVYQQCMRRACLVVYWLMLIHFSAFFSNTAKLYGVLWNITKLYFSHFNSTHFTHRHLHAAIDFHTSSWMDTRLILICPQVFIGQGWFLDRPPFFLLNIELSFSFIRFSTSRHLDRCWRHKNQCALFQI